MNSMRRMFLILSLLLPVTVLASGVASAETKNSMRVSFLMTVRTLFEPK